MSISWTLSAAKPPAVKLTLEEETASAWAVLGKGNRSLCRPLADRAEWDFEIDGRFPGFHPSVFWLLREMAKNALGHGIDQGFQIEVDREGCG